MEELLTNAFNTGDIKIVAVAAILYLIIHFQRKDTKTRRDDEHDKLLTRIALLEQQLDRISELDLATKLAQIQTDLTWLKEQFKEKLR